MQEDDYSKRLEEFKENKKKQLELTLAGLQTQWKAVDEQIKNFLYGQYANLQIANDYSETNPITGARIHNEIMKKVNAYKSEWDLLCRIQNIEEMLKVDY